MPENETIETTESNSTEEEVLEVDHQDDHEDQHDDEPEVFPRAYVEKLRNEAAGHRRRASDRDDLTQRLHSALGDRHGPAGRSQRPRL